MAPSSRFNFRFRNRIIFLLSPKLHARESNNRKSMKVKVLAVNLQLPAYQYIPNFSRNRGVLLKLSFGVVERKFPQAVGRRAETNGWSG
jgi:hypothetical protein